ncbi:large ribosomal subunit protein bL12m-like [Petromyzon marinus]|uniref:Large ribosomal subunit protein bL12m n=1 Tax=Petromyzon marinus TaxID=7757 RepID=A0AAJ7TS68_PETMA|nr:39S ribosomal protein L12, mitochondrial [Petromyzon marinus]
MLGALRLCRQLSRQGGVPCALRCLGTSSLRPADALAAPPLDADPHKFSPKVQQLVSDITSLSLLEVADLNKLLKKTLDIQDVGFMPMAAATSAAAPAEAEEDAPVKKEKTHFVVRLTEVRGSDKVKLIKEVKACIPGLNLVQAKKLVESLPQEIKANVPKEEANQLKAALEAAGGLVVLE